MCARKSIRIEKPVIVGIEGADFFYFLLAQVKNKPEFTDVQLMDFSSDPEKWLAVIKVAPEFETVRAIGIIRDSEESAESTGASLRAAFGKHGLSAPTATNEIIYGRPNVGYLLVPHGSPCGCIEDAILEAHKIKNDTTCVDMYVSCANNPNRNNNWRAKVAIHSIIAASDSPRSTLGESSLAGLWDFSQPSLAVILSFIASLAAKSPAGHQDQRGQAETR